MKLHFKIFSFILVLVGVSLWVNIHFSGKAVTEALSAQITDNAAAAAGDVSAPLQKALAARSELEAIKALHLFGQKTGALYAAVVATDGTIVAHTNVALTGTVLKSRLFDSPSPVEKARFRRADYNGEETVEILLPLRKKDKPSNEDILFEGLGGGAAPAGFLYAGLPLTHAKKAETSIIYRLILIAVLIAAAALGLSALFVRIVLGQLNQLRTGIRKVRDGDYNVLIPVISGDELGDVAISFNKLAKGLAETTVSKQYLDSLLESMPDPLIITDEEGKILKANMAAHVFSGHDFKTPLNIKDLLEPQADGGVEPFSLLSWTGHTKEMDLLFKAGDGSRIPVMLSAAFTGGAGRREAVIILKDTTQHKQSEAKLTQYLKEVEMVNSELDAFAHTVSHDLKEPLRGIEMFSNILLADFAKKLEPQAADYLGRISKASSRMRRLIDDLLSYARLARVRNPYEDTSTAVLAAEAEASLASAIEEKKAQITLAPGLPTLFGDPVKLRQVFQNLIANALKYNTSTAPSVRVAAERFGEYYWKFSVSDNGIGIPAQYYEEIFKMFKRLHSRQEFGGGTGAGLAIVKKIVEEHGGKVWVESKEGAGSVFYFLIPADLRNRP
ncbi:MAG: ATP-binding protein [Elusimicrobiales bacterium]|nr:ATP-binding protein [Elusimicrobiales bacterium]